MGGVKVFFCNDLRGRRVLAETPGISSTSLLKVLPIDSEIDARKLLFLGRLCRMNCETLPKQIFLARLFSYLEKLSNAQYGFIPDALQLSTTFCLSSLAGWKMDTFRKNMLGKKWSGCLCRLYTPRTV